MTVQNKAPKMPTKGEEAIGWAFLAALVIGAALMVRSCVIAPGDAKPNDAGYHIAAKQNVAAKLKDPQSAQFQNLIVSSKSGASIVCGEVNAKNGFGGYTGFKRFVSAGPGMATQIEGGEMPAAEFQKAWQRAC